MKKSAHVFGLLMFLAVFAGYAQSDKETEKNGLKTEISYSNGV